MGPKNRKGVTVIDVAVVLIILVVLAAVFLPAMYSVPNSSHRSDCKNKLKQLGLALHNYHETHSTFPPGWVAVRGPSSGEQERSAYGWGTYILPFVDQATTYKTIDFQSVDPSFQTQAQLPPKQFAQTIFPAYRCGSDLGESQDRTSSVALMGTTNYVGNFGVGIPLLEHESRMMQGIFGCNSRIRIRDIRDGTTNVVLVGERLLPQGGSVWTEGRIEGPFNSYWAGLPRCTHPLAIVGTVTDGDITESTNPEADMHEGKLNTRGSLNGFNRDPRQVREILVNKTMIGLPLTGFNKAKKTMNAAKSVTGSFNSYHSGGAQFLLGDGSVRFLNDGIDPNTLINLMRRADGELLGEF